MPKAEVGFRKVESTDLSKSNPASELIQIINNQFNSNLLSGLHQGKIIKHNGEAGQIAEVVLRGMLRKTLPMRFGVAKGKVTNPQGKLSRHLDIIIYDSLNFPALFIDENENQILPIESVYCVVEVKSNITKTTLTEAFDELYSVALLKDQIIRSKNRLVDYRPPILSIVGLRDSRSLDTLHKNYVELNKKYHQSFSSSCYSGKSPGFVDMTGQTYMIHNIAVVEKGTVYHMLDGSTAIGRWGENTIGLFISSILHKLSDIDLPDYVPTNYLSWLNAGSREIYR